MNKQKYPTKKIIFLTGLIIFYILFGVGIKLLSNSGVIESQISFTKEKSLEGNLDGTHLGVESQRVYRGLISAEQFLKKNFVEENNHVNLIYGINSSSEEDNFTNSEAISYYLLWNVQSKNKMEADKTIVYLQENMMHPEEKFLMWKLNDGDKALEDGRNAATDADLRTIRALYIAYENWGDKKYLDLISEISSSLERNALTTDNLFAPYMGVSDSGIVWKTEEVWLSYVDFIALSKLAEDQGRPWDRVYMNMKNEILKSQLDNGLYRIQLTEDRQFHNSLDGGHFSINSLWIMVRSAESSDSELKRSSRKSLNFYKEKFEGDGKIVVSYDEFGEIANPDETPWVYAIVALAAIELEDREFSDKLIGKILDFQVNDSESDLYGAIPEGSKEDLRVTQFTMQESIFTFQAYLRKFEGIPFR